MKAMILAAGTGTRLRPLTALRPKPLFPVYTVPLLHITVERLVKAGVREIMVNSHHLSRQITDFLEHHTGSGASLSHSHEPDLLGTGGAVKKVEWFWGQEPFLVVNGDILHTVDLMAAYRTHVANGNLATLILHEYPRFNNVEVDGEGTIVGMRDKKVRKTSSATTMLAFTGIHIISPQLLDEIPPLRYVDIIEIYGDLAARGLNIRGHRTRDHYWRDIGTPEDYHCIHRDIYENRMHLADTVTLPAPAANGSAIGEGTTLSGYVSLGKNSRIGRNCSITDSIIWDNVSINDNCTIRNCIIGDGASVNNSTENKTVV